MIFTRGYRATIEADLVVVARSRRNRAMKRLNIMTLREANMRAIVAMMVAIGAAGAAVAGVDKVEPISVVDCSNPADPTCSYFADRGLVVKVERAGSGEAPTSFTMRLPNHHVVTENIDPDDPLSAQQIAAMKAWLKPGKAISATGSIAGSGRLRNVRCISPIAGRCLANAPSHD